MEKPIGYTPGYKGGYWRSAKSKCCNTWLVYYQEEAKRFVHWAGWEDLPEELQCRRCSKVVYQKGANGAKAKREG